MYVGGATLSLAWARESRAVNAAAGICEEQTRRMLG